MGVRFLVNSDRARKPRQNIASFFLLSVCGEKEEEKTLFQHNSKRFMRTQAITMVEA